MDANWRRDAIVELLRQKGKVKARELAKRFHVTRQTICQDITVLSLHCDIYTERGQNGGIYLLEKRGPFVNRLVHLRFKYLNNFCLLYQRKSVLSFSPCSTSVLWASGVGRFAGIAFALWYPYLRGKGWKLDRARRTSLDGPPRI